MYSIPVTGSSNNKKGKYTTSISNIQNRLKKALDQKLQSSVKTTIDSDLIEIKELSRREIEEVELKKYHNKNYDDDYDSGFIKIDRGNLEEIGVFKG